MSNQLKYTTDNKIVKHKICNPALSTTLCADSYTIKNDVVYLNSNITIQSDLYYAKTFVASPAYKVQSQLYNIISEIFDTNTVPAVYYFRNIAGKTPKLKWRPAKHLTKDLAIKMHLAGQWKCGVYPFRGIDKLTGQDLGTKIGILDIDAHNGETDVNDIYTKIRARLLSMGIGDYLVFTSGGGHGLHVYLLFEEAIPTTSANRLLKIISKDIAPNRIDCIPSERHSKLGTLIALPLSPYERSLRGGGVLRSSEDITSIVEAPSAVIRELNKAHRRRIPVALINEIISKNITKVINKSDNKSIIGFNNNALEETPAFERSCKVDIKSHKLTDIRIIDHMLKRHPQFRSVMFGDWALFKGKRSARDCYMANMLLRQGVSKEGTYDFLKLHSFKASTQQDKYLFDIITASSLLKEKSGHDEPVLKERESITVSISITSSSSSSSSVNFLINKEYVKLLGNASIAERLSATNKEVSKVIALLIHIWSTGRELHRNRSFFIGIRELALKLNISKSYMHKLIDIIHVDFKDIIRISKGAPHKFLKMANMYDYVWKGRTEVSKDQVDWDDLASSARDRRKIDESSEYKRLKLQRESLMMQVTAAHASNSMLKMAEANSLVSKIYKLEAKIEPYEWNYKLGRYAKNRQPKKLDFLHAYRNSGNLAENEYYKNYHNNYNSRDRLKDRTESILDYDF